MRMHFVNETTIIVAPALGFPRAFMQIACSGWLAYPRFGKKRTESDALLIVHLKARYRRDPGTHSRGNTKSTKEKLEVTENDKVFSLGAL